MLGQERRARARHRSPAGTANGRDQLDRINQGFVLGNKVMVGTVNASPDDFRSGVDDLIKAEALYPGWLEQLLTTPIDGLENYEEMIRALTDDRDAIKVYVEVAPAGPEQAAAPPPGRSAAIREHDRSPAPRPPWRRPALTGPALADCNSAALVDRRRAPSTGSACRATTARRVFARILDPDAGHWSIRPAGRVHEPSAATCPGTLVLETTFTTDDRRRAADRRAGRSPTGQRGHDLGPRRAARAAAPGRGRRGEVELVLELAPRPEYGLVRPLFRPDGGRRRAPSAVPTGSRLRAGVPVSSRGRDDARGASRVARGRERRLRAALGPARGTATPSRPRPTRSLRGIDDTVEAWRSWEAEHDVYDGPAPGPGALQRARAQGPHLPAHRRDRRGPDHVAARDRRRRAQLGLPLRLDPRRQPDLEALYIGACSDEAEDFVSFMTSSAGGGSCTTARCRSCTGSAASTTSPSAAARTCAAGATRRRCGSATAPGARTQLDVYGELLERAPPLSRSSSATLHPEIQRFAADLADAAAPALARARRRACGRCAASRATTSPRRCSAGSRSTAP